MIWIDIDMPKNCRDCPLHDVDEEQCPIYSIYKDDYDKSRFDKCPLHEITADPDTISRKQAIDALESDYAYAAAKIIKALPPSPSRPKGRWIPVTERLPKEKMNNIVNDFESVLYAKKNLTNKTGFFTMDIESK